MESGGKAQAGRGLLPGTALGHYQIIGELGTGGMGAVYRARDARLGRDVAIKVLTIANASSEWLSRFELEARATGALNHPNVVAVYDVGSHDGAPYVVTEVLEGQTLRERLARGPLPPSKAIDVATQIAQGLAAAHDKGIVHRDLKPENVFLLKDGRVKLLDFGLAKMTGLEAGLTAADRAKASTLPVHTEPGLILGTVGYMSPEQVRGKYVDHRTDIFSFGTVLYEMLAGARAFDGESQIDTINAILQKDPPDLEDVPRTLQKLVARCLDKDPLHRFQSARDLAFNLDALAVTSSGGESLNTPAITVRKRWKARRFAWRPVALVLAGAAAASLAWALVPRPAPVRVATAVAPVVPAPPEYRPLTFRQGRVVEARFAASGQLVVYSASWDGAPGQVYSTLPGNPEARVLVPGPSRLLAVSASGEMAVMLSAAVQPDRFGDVGTLARVSMGGGAPRLLAERVEWADWAPGAGEELAVVREVDGKIRLESPLGTVLVEAAGWIGSPRFSPDGQTIAYLDHPVRGDDRARVMTVARGGGAPKPLGEEWSSAQGLAWSPSGDEVWFTAAATGVHRALRAVRRDGQTRLVASVPGTLTLLDVARDGRVLVTRDKSRMQIILDGRDASWFDWSFANDLSDDGRTLVFTEAGGDVAPFRVYLREQGADAVRLGEGLGGVLSPDGTRVLALSGTRRRQLVIYSAGAGESRPLVMAGLERRGGYTWFRDGRRALIQAATGPGQPARVYLVTLDGSEAPRAVGPDGADVGNHALAPDERAWIGKDMVVYPVGGGPGRKIPGARPGDIPARWSSDGKAVFVTRAGAAAGQSLIERVDVTTGARKLLRTVEVADPAGVNVIHALVLSADGAHWAASHQRILGELFLVDFAGR